MTRNDTEKKINDIISKMTLEEQVSLCHANSKFTVSGIERLGIDELVMSDGPHGVRGEVARHTWQSLKLPIDLCTYLPTETALAATWNPSLARKFGETLGSEARYRGKDIINGPGVNIIRTPLCGRNFEYMSEDPCLIQKMSPELVRGIESQDVAACVKHYCLNNQELDRDSVDVSLSRRALHEIYLKGFYSAIIEGGASSVMGAYNKYEGQHCCHNDYLINKVLKGDWQFDGAYITDWNGAHDTDECIFNGLDIEMGTLRPYNEYYLADAFLEKAQKSAQVRLLLEDKVRRILRLMLKIRKHSPERLTGEYNTPEHQRVSGEIASEAMVLLKNDSLLPLSEDSCKKILVVGSNAAAKHSEGGNSSGVRALYEISPLEGLKNYLSEHGSNCELEYVSDIFELKYRPIPIEILNILDMRAGCRSCVVESGENGTVSYPDNINISDGAEQKYRLLLSATVPESGPYSFKFGFNCKARIVVNGIELNYLCSSYTKFWEETLRLTLSEGECLRVEAWIEKTPNDFKDTLDFTFGWIAPSEISSHAGKQTIIEKAAEADAVIYCAGLGHSYDTEGFDRKDMRLPPEQQVLIPEVLRANPNTVVTVTAGSPVEMPWIDDAKAVLWTWYAGMEGGNVLAKILFGDTVPSGKMPFTLPKKYEDHPVARYGEYQARSCKYNEDIMVGYRGFDIDGIEPMFPFGHGLSYSSFEYSNISVSTNEQSVCVSFDIKNIGGIDAYETSQLYIGDPECSAVRPIRELRNFKKVFLRRGETQRVTLEVSAMDLSFYDEASEDFVLERGEFIAEVGSSSRDIRLSQSFEI